MEEQSMFYTPTVEKSIFARRARHLKILINGLQKAVACCPKQSVSKGFYFCCHSQKSAEQKNERLKIWKLTIFYLSKSRNSRAVEWEELSGSLCPVYLWGSPVPTHVLQRNQHFMQWWKLDHLTKFGSAVDAFAYPSFAFESRRQPLLTMYQRNNVNQALYPTPNVNILYSFLHSPLCQDKYLDHYLPINENLTSLGQEFAAV